ncbi:fasciclin domain-containing protein [Aeromicrobium sp. CTD01-1L150]|uniref:fasciclin domain-containing protein n=1 Tax=Aeromicrobium sp. CTD01-1L150 TaxID=3341830 RepID=UPI0035C06544
MRTTKTGKSLAIAAVTSLAMFSVACSSSDDDSSAEDSATEDAADDDASADLVGPGCADYVAENPEGPASVEAMAQEPLATAVSGNALLTTFAQAVSGELNSEVDLTETLDEGEFTVFAPVDDAFAALPEDTVDTLGTPEGAGTLESVLTYHVIEGQLSPDEIVGTHTTREGDEVEVRGDPETLTVGADDANVVCGGVKTANATVYLIDAVLMPPEA